MLKKYVVNLFLTLLAFGAPNAFSAGMVGGAEYGQVRMAYSCIDHPTLNNITVTDGISSPKQLPVSSSGVFVDYPTDTGIRNYTFTCYYGDYSVVDNGVYTDTGYGYAGAPLTQGLSVTGNNSQSVSLSWGSANGATVYAVYRATTPSGVGELLATVFQTTYVDTQIASNTVYYYTVKAKAHNVEGEVSNKVVGWRQIPSPLSFIASQGTVVDKVALSWSYVPEASAYRILRSETPGEMGSLLGSTPSNNYSDNQSGGGVNFYYTIVPIFGDAVGTPSYQQIGWGKIGLPGQTTGVAATEGSLYGKVRVSWLAADKADSYQVYRSASQGDLGSLLSQSVAGLSFEDTSLPSGSTYYYTVVSANSGGNGPASAQVGGWVKPVPIISDLAATQGTEEGSVKLIWSPSADATSYDIFRAATSGGAVTKIGTTATVGFDDTSTSSYGWYFYTVKVNINSNAGVVSNEAAGYRKLPVVADLTASHGTLTGKSQLAWGVVADATGYEVWRSAVNGVLGTKLASVMDTTYVDTTTGADIQYYYTIKTKVGTLTSYQGNVATGWGKLPDGVSSLTATQGTVPGLVKLAWSTTPDADGYEIWRTTVGGSGYQLLLTSATAGYDDATATDPYTRYVYAIKAKAQNLTGNFGNEATGWPKPPDAVTSLTATKGTYIALVRLDWASNPDAEGYQIWRATAADADPLLVGTVSADVISYDDTQVTPLTNYYYTVRMVVGQVMGLPSNQDSGFGKAIPPAPTISFKGGTLISDGKFYVPPGQIVTKIAAASVFNEKIKITVTQNNQATEKEVSNRSLFPLSITDLGVLEERPVVIRAAWRDYPSVYTEQTITAVGGTVKGVKLFAEAPASVADTNGLVVNVRVGVNSSAGIDYDPVTMGQWRAQLLLQTGAQLAGSPITDWVDMADGQAQFVLDPTGSQSMKITAVAQLVSTVPNLDVKLNSAAKFVQILNGSPLQGVISAKQFDAPAPKAFTLNLDLMPNSRGALKSIAWQESADNGLTWAAIPNSDGTRLSVSMPYPDRKLVRAKMVNKNTLVESYAEPVELLAYTKLNAVVVGPRNSAPGTPAVLAADVYSDDGIRVNDPIVEWSFKNSAGQQSATGPTVSVVDDQEVRVTVTMRARSKDTRTDDSAAWAYAKYFLSFKMPRPPSVSVVGPREVEVGKSHHFKGTVKPSWGGEQSALNIVSEWVLPGGTVSAGADLDWTPTASDLSANEPLVFRAWVDGFKDSTLSETKVPYAAWEYIWPNFSIDMKQLSVQAPADLVLAVKNDQPSMDRRFEGLTYSWTFPAGITGRQNASFPNRASAQAVYAGGYDVAVSIQDARGNKTDLVQHVVAEQAVSYSTTLKVSKSNPYGRVPMTAVVRSTISGGHPLDKVVGQSWAIDGVPVGGFVNRSVMVADITEPGDHLISHTLTSKMGQTTTVESPLTLVANQPPVCQLVSKQNALAVSVEAKCTDADGKVVGYSWEVDGQPIGSTSYRISFSKTATPQSASVTITAVDDSKGYSAPVSITVGY